MSTGTDKQVTNQKRKNTVDLIKDELYTLWHMPGDIDLTALPEDQQREILEYRDRLVRIGEYVDSLKATVAEMLGKAMQAYAEKDEAVFQRNLMADELRRVRFHAKVAVIDDIAHDMSIEQGISVQDARRIIEVVFGMGLEEVSPWTREQIRERFEQSAQEIMDDLATYDGYEEEGED